MRAQLLAVVGIALAAGCFVTDDEGNDGAFEDSFQDDDLPMGGCSGTGCATDSGDSNAPQVPVGEPCDGANECESGSCAATFVQGEAGPLVCRSTCIGTGTTDAWCSDDASCCAGLTCSPRGLCLAAPDADSGSDGDSDSGPDGDSSTGAGSSEG